MARLPKRVNCTVHIHHSVAEKPSGRCGLPELWERWMSSFQETRYLIDVPALVFQDSVAAPAWEATRWDGRRR